MKHVRNIILFCIGFFSTTFALVPELDSLTKALEVLEAQLHQQPEQPKKPEKPSEEKAPAIWLKLAINRMIGPATTEVITSAPPYELESGSQIKQVEVLSQFLTLGAFLRKEDDLMYDNIKALLPTAKQTTIMQSTPFFENYILRLTSNNANKELQRSTKWNNKDNYIAGGKESSGYHALKNALYAIQAARTKTASENLFDTLNIQDANMLFGIAQTSDLILGKNEDGTWRKLIKDYRQKQGITIAEGQNLQEDEITYLLTQEEVKNMIDVEFFNFSVFNVSIKNLNQESILLQQTDPGQANDYQNIIAQRKTMISSTFTIDKQNYVHAFILGGTSKVFPDDHWATLVVNIVNGKVQYLILDSTNAPRYQTDTFTYKNTPEYIEERIIGPLEDIAHHINEVIGLIEDARK